jgi:hypothetical protein
MNLEAKCEHCRKARGLHNAKTAECPTGTRSGIGYTQFGPTVFKEKIPAARKKFPTKTQLATAGIINAHQLADLQSEPKVYVSFAASDNGRGGTGAKFQVIRIGYITDPKAHFLDRGRKTFTVFGFPTKEAAAHAACEWAEARYGKREWVRDPFGSYQDVRVIGLAWAAVDAATAERTAPIS